MKRQICRIICDFKTTATMVKTYKTQKGERSETFSVLHFKNNYCFYFLKQFSTLLEKDLPAAKELMGQWWGAAYRHLSKGLLGSVHSKVYNKLTPAHMRE